MGFYNNLCPSCMNEVGENSTCPYCGFDLKKSQTAPFLAYGTVLAGKYVVGDVLESNGEGITYLGLDTITNNCVRIREFFPEKIAKRNADELKPVIADEDNALYKSFRKEFLTMWHSVMKLKTLDCVITVLDVFEANDTAYAVAEADGSKTLTEFLEEKGGRLDWKTIKEKLFPAIEAVEALNKEGVIHGAISPDTLFLCSNGRFKPWGFGISATRKINGKMINKIDPDIRPGYAAAEQYDNDMTLSPATDAYGFTAVLYKCVTGSAPIVADIRLKEDTLSIPADYARELPDYVLAGFISGLQVLPEDRTQDMTALSLSFTKEGFESQKKLAKELSAAALIDPISDIKDDTAVPPVKTASPVAVKTAPAVTVISKNNEEEKKSNENSMIILSVSIVLVMSIFFACLALTGVISFNFGGGTTQKVVEIPDFSNYKKDDTFIVQVAESYGLQITLEPASSTTVPQGVIFEQSIAPGTKAARGSAITLTYSRGNSTVTLPNFTGMTFTETVYYLGKLNLSYNIVEKANTSSQSAGTVASMTPAAGSVVYEGTEVTIEVWGDASGGTVTGPNTGSQVTSSSSIIDSIFGRLSDSVSGLGNTIQNFFN